MKSTEVRKEEDGENCPVGLALVSDILEKCKAVKWQNA